MNIAGEAFSERLSHPRDRLFVVLALVLPLLAIFAPLGLTVLLIVAALVALACEGPLNLLRALPRWPSAMAAALVAWGLASVLWAIEPDLAFYKAAQLAPMFVAGLILITAVQRLSAEGRAAVETALCFGVAAALTVIGFEVLLGTPISRFLARNEIEMSLLVTRYNRGATVMAVLLVPAVVAIARRRGWAVALGAALAGGVVLVFLNSRTAVIGAFLGIAVAALALARPRLATAALALVMTVVVFLFPLVPQMTLSDPQRAAAIQETGMRYQVLSLVHRLRIWEFTVERISERPLLGWGLASSRALPGGKRDSEAAGELMPLHPHNAPLQVRVELGVLGVLFGGGLLLLPLARSWRSDRESAAIILATLTAAAVVASMSYGIWQSWWVAAVWLIATVGSIGLRPLRPAP